jgi:hypothetical protein
MFKRLRDLVPAFAGLLIMFATFGVSGNLLAVVWQQDPQKRIKTDALSRPEREPIVVTGLKLGEREVNLNAPFEDHDDQWIRKLTFKLRNQSSKNVTYVGVNLFIPGDSQSANEGLVQQFRYGQLPNRVASTGSPILLKPGDAIDVSLSAAKYQSIKQFIDSTQPLRKVDNVMIKVYLVFFEDGTKWDGGEFYVSDTAQPSGYRKIEPPPGIISKNPPF